MTRAQWSQRSLHSIPSVSDYDQIIFLGAGAPAEPDINIYM